METLTLEEFDALYRCIVETGHVKDKAIRDRLIRMGCIDRDTMQVTDYGYRLAIKD